MNTNITINWKGKENQRGLTEEALSLLNKLGKTGDAEILQKKYYYLTARDSKTNLSRYSFHEELKLVREFVRVVGVE